MLAPQQTFFSTGHVYRYDRGSFVVVVYDRTGCNVYVAILPEADTVTEAIAELSAKFAARFVHADSDTQKWAECLMKGQTSAMLL